MPIYLPVTTVHGKDPAEIWGDVRPARFVRADTGTAQRVKIEFQPKAGGGFRTLRTVTVTDPDGYFDVLATVPGSGTIRTAWSYPHGPEIVSRSVAVTVR